jgi:hypothetical protein
MTVRNQHWYDRNESRAYPLDDSATANTDDGLILPPNIVVDLSMRFPSTAGEFAFFNAITVTPTLVTVMILSTGQAILPSGCEPVSASASGSAIPDTRVPLAVVSLPKPVPTLVHIPLQPQIEGVGGWIVFGSGINEAGIFSGRFSEPEQSFIVPKAAKSYDPLPVSSFGKFGSQAALTGLVELRAGNDIEIVPTSVTLAGLPRDAIQIRLRDQANVNVFETYTGPCADRPESNTCEGPQPIETINGIGPDCDGRITLEFVGCADARQIVSGAPCGAILDCGFGLIDACSTEDRLPDDQGNLPSDSSSDCPEN